MKHKTKYQPRWVIFCKKNRYKLSDNNTTEYILWISLMAKVYELEKGVENIVDQKDFTRFLKVRNCGKNF